MGYLTKEEIRQVRDALEQRGLTYAQLQDELLDHLICDIEVYMQQGLSFQQAWQKVDADIPKNQLIHIQNETMEILNRKIGTIKIMILSSFFLLVSATVFKLLHLQGADMLLLSGFGASALTILLSSFKGFYANPNKKGRYLILIIGFLIVAFIISIVFQVLHWKGGLQLRLGSVIGFILLFPAVSAYFFQSKQRAQDHPLILLTEENRKIIERIVLSLVSLGVIFKLPVLLKTSPYNFAPTLFLILAIFIVGLYMFTFTWKSYVSALSGREKNATAYLLVVSIVAFILFMLPAMSRMFPQKVLFGFSVSFFVLLIGMVMVYYLFYSQDQQRNLLALFCALILCIPVLRFFMDMALLSGPVAALISNSIYNAGILLGLILLLIVFYKKTVFRTFMLLLLAEYALYYPVA